MHCSLGRISEQEEPRICSQRTLGVKNSCAAHQLCPCRKYLHQSWALVCLCVIWASQVVLVVRWKSLSRVRLFATPWTIQSMEFSRPEYFPTQGSNPGLPHRRQILYQLSHKESPRTLEWVAYPFSSIFPTQELNRGLLHCRLIFFTSWVTRESIYQCRRHRRCKFNPWIRKIPWRRAQQPTPVFLPGESHEQRSLPGYSP